MSLAREFPIVHLNAEARHLAAAQIKCSGCGITDTISISAPGGWLPDDVISKKFTARGWQIASKRARDLCKACSTKERKPVLKIAEAEKPREMGREDRRIIFEKLNETYLDEKTGYDTGWSDHRVATDLGVPRKWVEQVREEMFGSIGTNAEMNDFLRQSKEALDEAREFLAEAKRVRDALDTLSKSPAFATANVIADRLSKIDRLANEVRKLVTV